MVLVSPPPFSEAAFDSSLILSSKFTGTAIIH
jgi:hypothetical protein